MEKMELSEALKANASVLEELIGVATSEKDGLMPSIQRMTTSYQKDQQKYCKIAEFRNRLTGISMLISVFKNHENSSPSVVLLTGYSDDLSVNSIKRGIYLTNVYYQKKENKTIVYVKSSAYVYISTLCIGMNGSLKLSHENNLDLPSDAIEIPISWQEFSNIWELEGLLPLATNETKGLASMNMCIAYVGEGPVICIKPTKLKQYYYTLLTVTVYENGYFKKIDLAVYYPVKKGGHKCSMSGNGNMFVKEDSDYNLYIHNKTLNNINYCVSIIGASKYINIPSITVEAHPASVLNGLTLTDVATM